MNIAGKGVLLLGVFVAIGIIVLSEGFNDTTGGSESLSIPEVTEEPKEQANTTEEETVAEEETATEETESTVPVQEAPVSSSESVLHPPAEVRVLVANGTEVGGAAGAIREVLISDQGYNGLPPVNAATEEVPEFSFVYYANGYELDARNVGLIIGADSANILPIPAALPVTDLAEANILILLGSDLYPPEE
ncbi:MAG: LytR C-terminal domain-containing protein [Acidimicrobiales bacterium]|nr:LytR C-terminal domain-containing protein [Acidimicrobiales bacterium]